MNTPPRVRDDWRKTLFRNIAIKGGARGIEVLKRLRDEVGAAERPGHADLLEVIEELTTRAGRRIE